MRINTDGLHHMFSFTVPVRSEISKNARYTVAGRGARRWIANKTSYKKAVGEVQGLCEIAMHEAGYSRLPKTKIWVLWTVFKPDNRSDSANTVDGVLDGVKEAVGVDDRWFAHGTDWKIDRENPRMEIEIYAESMFDQKVDKNTLKLVDSANIDG